MIIPITKEQALQMISEKAISKELCNNSEFTVFAFTQAWCPQWSAMQSYFNDIISEYSTCTIYTLEYDKEPFFLEFMNFKEKILGNSLVPYMMYYKNGKMVNESNFCMKQDFISLMKGE